MKTARKKKAAKKYKGLRLAAQALMVVSIEKGSVQT